MVGFGDDLVTKFARESEETGWRHFGLWWLVIALLVGCKAHLFCEEVG